MSPAGEDSTTTRFARIPVRRAERHPDAAPEHDSWPFVVPAVRALLADGLDLAPVTVLVGENGSGKSTVVEAIAMAYGLSPEGGSVHASHSTRATKSPLHDLLRLSPGITSSRWGFFLRAETMHGFFSYLEENPGPKMDPVFHEMSHGESFLADIADSGGQAVVATHSPVVASIPGARILELGEWGMREVAWTDLELVNHWRRFLDSPAAYLRHMLD